MTYWKDEDGLVHVAEDILVHVGTLCGRTVPREQRHVTYEMRDGKTELVTCPRCAELSPGGP